MRPNDLAGVQFGFLTAIKKVGLSKSGQCVWMCRCVCGKELNIDAGRLRSRVSPKKSCGCKTKEIQRETHIKDLSGKTFGQLTVLRRTGESNNRGSALWLCSCTCGKTTITANPSRSLGVRNCGCRRNLPWGIGARNAVIHGYKSNAKMRGLKWELSLDQFMLLTQQNCHYCGIAPTNKSENSTGIFTYSGIDRTHNQTGYEFSNCVSCCATCNHAKKTMTKKEFLLWVKRVHDFNASISELTGSVARPT